MKKTMILASALLMGAAMPALANDSKNMSDSEKSAKFNEIDTDKSGSISMKEYDAAGKSDSDFNAADTNNDDKLSMAELNAWRDKEYNQSSNMNGRGSNSVDNQGKATGSGTSSVGGANERVRSGDATKTSH